MPFPSAACQTCKTRRIKCDETKPICSRCSKAGRPCVDREAARQAAFTIHVENRYASGKAKRPRGPRSSLTTLPPKIDLQTRALAYYLHEHFQVLPDAPNIWGGLSECVSIWKASNRTCVMVELALASMALTVFSRAHNHPPAATEASVKYHRLLCVAQKKVALVGTSAAGESDLDAYLLSVSLMSRYESALLMRADVTETPCSKWGSCWSHHDGAVAILKFWLEGRSEGTPPRIIKHARRDLIKCFLLRSLPLPDWVLDGEKFGEGGCELEYDRVFVQTVNLALLSQQEGCRLPEEAEKLNMEARGLDDALQRWVAHIPSGGCYRQDSLPEPGSWPSKHFYSAQVYSFSKLGYAAVWCEYFATRMLINSTRLRIIDASDPDSRCWLTHKMQRVKCIAQLGRAADGLASTVPFCLGRFTAAPPPPAEAHSAPITFDTNEQIRPHRANLVVWPLTVASSVGGTSPEQKRWFRAELADLGKLTGDGVLEVAESAQWGVL